MFEDVTILSTRQLKQDVIDLAADHAVRLDCVSFIHSAPIENIEVQQEIEQAACLKIPVVFTSGNAVDVVADCLNGMKPAWEIFCIGHATAEKVISYFGADCIIGKANDADELADIILGYNPAEVCFFCGNKRRDNLPVKLSNADILVNEVVVYETTLLPVKVNTAVSGILFFSPSAVEAFFHSNSVGSHVIFFAIGFTTAEALRNRTKNKIVVAEEPSEAMMIKTVFEFFKLK